MRRVDIGLRLLVLWLLAFATLQRSHAQQPAMALPVFDRISKIALNENGNPVFISLDSASLSVFVFLSPECPLCKNYSTVLSALTKQFNGYAKFYGLVPGAAYSDEAVKTFARTYKLNFPVYTDLQMEFSRYTKALVTPEVLVVDKTGQAIYRGAIDDWVVELGRKKLKAGENYLRDAILSYRSGQPPARTQTVAKGCFINEF